MGEEIVVVCFVFMVVLGVVVIFVVYVFIVCNEG